VRGVVIGVVRGGGGQETVVEEVVECRGCRGEWWRWCVCAGSAGVCESELLYASLIFYFPTSLFYPHSLSCKYQLNPPVGSEDVLYVLGSGEPQSRCHQIHQYCLGVAQRGGEPGDREAEGRGIEAVVQADCSDVRIK
jgi:hypothetical protein